MDEKRVASLVILAGGVGLVVGRMLFVVSRHDGGDFWSVWTAFVYFSLGLSLILIGLATWHFLRFGVGTLVATGLLAVVALLFTLNDFVDGDPVWSRGYSEAELVGSWLIIASTVMVLIGVLWSVEQHLTDVAGVAWWRGPWVIVVGGVAVLSIIGGVSFIFFGDEDAQLTATTADEGDVGPVQDEWSITSDGDVAGSYVFSMIKTFSPMEEADVEDVGGRLVWPETEIDLCDVNTYSAGDAFVQIGIVLPTTEGCPGMLPAFVDFGLPESACLFVRSNGIDDEYCAPLVVD
jgi:hypothetical protein